MLDATGPTLREDGFSDASAEAAAASAAASVLEQLHPQSAADFKVMLDDYLKALPGPRSNVAKGIRLGELISQRIIDARAGDGAIGPDSYRPRTQPGVYVPTATMVAAPWPKLRPFVIASPDQFRPGPPVELASQEWASDYNEVKAYG